MKMKWINKNQEAITMLVTSFFSILLAILSNFIFEYLKSNFKIDNMFFLIVFLLINLFLLFKISQIFVFIKHKVFIDIYDEMYVQQAFITMKELANVQGEKLQTTFEGEGFTTQLLIQNCNDNIMNIVKQCFEFFDNAFSSKRELVKTINFEVTFMTKSYIDGEITIPAAYNRDHTQPLSMIRRKENIKIYDNTITAQVYQEYSNGEKPKVHIIPDTHDEKVKRNHIPYNFIYNGQGERIKSSIVLPIISHRNELLGTLVVHCDKKNFFKIKKEKLWKEILEIFAVEIGKEKIYIDILINNNILGLKPPF